MLRFEESEGIYYLDIPKEVRYLSDCSDLLKTSLPQNSHYILDKRVTGCGATEYFIGNGDNIILASPRKALLQNKKDQHKDEVFLVINDSEKTNYDKDLSPTDKSSSFQDKVLEDKSYILSLQNDIRDYYTNCLLSNKPCKILVTYDSLKHVLSALGDSSKSFYVIVDEFQSIFTDSSFKAEVELNFVDYLQSIPSVCYLSATPILHKYIKELDEFRDLQYIKLSWDSSHIIKPVVYRKKVNSLAKGCIDFVNNYLNGNFMRKAINGQIVESKEVVFYINSIKEISLIINKMNKTSKVLTPENTNIICADTKKNKVKLKRIGFKIGTIPLKGEPHKMFTFCTRTVYLGADFYSTSAYTVIFSNYNIDCLALDISLDLPQILGRQRLRENVFRHEAILYYRTKETKITEEELEKYLSDKVIKTNSMLDLFFNKANKLQKDIYLEQCRRLIGVDNYRENFIGISEKSGGLVLNKLVLLSERRAWEIQQKNYDDDIDIYESGSTVNFQELVTNQDKNFRLFFDQFFNVYKNFDDRMKLYCLFADEYGDTELKHTKAIDDDYKFFYEILGSKRIRALSYRKVELENEISIIKSTDKTFSMFSDNFILGQRYTLKYIKAKITNIYSILGFKKTAKSTDLEQYFNLRRCRITINGKKEEGLEILSIK